MKNYVEELAHVDELLAAIEENEKYTAESKEADAKEQIAWVALTNWIDSKQVRTEAVLAVEKATAQLVQAQKATADNEKTYREAKTAAEEAAKRVDAARKATGE